MASVKLATLAIRTIAKPISSRLKTQAKEHETFRNFCVGFAQLMHRSEVRLRTQLMGEPAIQIRPLSEARAIENGANAIAEGFLFAVAAGLILGESWRTSRNQSKRRDAVDDSLEDLGTQVTELTTRVNELATKWEDELTEVRQRNSELTKILERIVEIGMRGGGIEFDGPLQLTRLKETPQLPIDNASVLPENTLELDTKNPEHSSDSDPESKSAS